MKNVMWLLQGNMRNQLSLKQMIEALERLGIDYQTADLAAFQKDIPKDTLLRNVPNIICWGPSFVPRTLGHPDLNPGIWYDHETFRWSCFKENWADLMLCPNGKVVSFDTAVSELSEEPVFMRPDADNKAFNGGVFTSGQPPILGSNFTDIQVVVAPVQSVQNEWRFFIAGQNIVAASSYRVRRQANIDGFVPPEATRLAEKAIRIWGPADVYCLDIGHSGGKYGIVEANCFNASRLYGAAHSSVAQAVSEFVGL